LGLRGLYSECPYGHKDKGGHGEKLIALVERHGLLLSQKSSVLKVSSCAHQAQTVSSLEPLYTGSQTKKQFDKLNEWPINDLNYYIIQDFITFVYTFLSELIENAAGEKKSSNPINKTLGITIISSFFFIFYR